MKTIILFALLCMPTSAAYGQDAPKFQTSVSLTVSAEDFDGQINSYMGRELRALSDVAIKEKNADFRLSVIAVKIKNAEGRTVGCALSFTICDKLRYGDLLERLNLSPADALTVEKRLDEISVLQQHYMRTGGTESLHTMCKEFIAFFDTYYVEVWRKQWREHYEGLKKRKSKMK